MSIKEWIKHCEPPFILQSTQKKTESASPSAFVWQHVLQSGKNAFAPGVHVVGTAGIIAFDLQTVFHKVHTKALQGFFDSIHSTAEEFKVTVATGKGGGFLSLDACLVEVVKNGELAASRNAHPCQTSPPQPHPTLPFNDYEIQLHFYRKACYSVEVQEPAAQGSLNRISQKEAQKHYARL